MKRLISFIIATIILVFTVSCTKEKEYDTLTYRFDYDLSDYIKLGEYEGLPANGYRNEVSEEDIETHVNATLAVFAETVEVTDRGAKVGDTVYINYVGTVDGEEFTGGSAENYALTLGFSSLGEDFENAVKGHTVGDTVSVDTKLPSPYDADTDLSGKDVHYNITIEKITKEVLPEYTDEFVRETFKYDSIKAYEDSIREMYEMRYKAYYYKEVINQVWDVLVENTEVIKYPKNDLKKAYDSYIASIEAYVEHVEMRLEDYIGIYHGMTVDEFYVEAENIVKEQMKEDMILYAIARAENITISDEEYTERATEYALSYYEMESLEEFEAMYGVETIREMILFDLVREHIADCADITYID